MKRIVLLLIVALGSMTAVYGVQPEYPGSVVGVNPDEQAGQPIADVAIYPNPNDGQFRLTFTVAEFADVNIEVLDIAGKTCYSKELPHQAGRQEYRIDMTQFPAGYYFLSIRTDNQRIVKRITKT